MFSLLGSPWAAIASFRTALYERGWRRRYRLERPVISVGALSVGGAGKTPATALVGAILASSGHRPAVLSRGYKRRGSEPLLVSAGDGNGPMVSAAEGGDEPFWLASVLPEVRVAVARHREDAARIALSGADVDVFVLDDGFQHLRVRRDVDLLAVSASAPFWNDAPLPAGRLRESPSAAGRADAFLLVGSHPEAAASLRRRFPDRECFELCSTFPGVWSAGTSPPAASVSPASSSGDHPGPGTLERPVLAFAGIARPERFFDDLRQAGVSVAATRTYRDHHPYSAGDLASLASTAAARGAAALVTTEKDAVRLPARLPQLPVCVWGYRLSCADPSRLLEWLRERAGLTPSVAA